MASLISGYSYDIFISYRQKDNRSQWVTHFVQALQEELDSTFKEDISIYFDENPHDGLLEMHHVSKSLEGKLKCLIFIPVISQTYCDPNAYAWTHEFCVFNRMAKNDRLGMDITLSNGNVTSRILPVKIHELDAEDTATIEREIGSVLRAIEFIFKSPGVNRPLSHEEDHASDNQNKSFYKDQINKVANAIKEIVSSIKAGEARSVEASRQQAPGPTKSTSRRLALASLVVLVLAAVGYFFYPFNEAFDEGGELERSIAVLPFTDMSPDRDQEYFSDGISEEIINALAKLPGLKVTGRTSSFAYKGKDTDLKAIGEALGVSTVLEGSVRKSGNTLRVTAQLINASTGFHLWTESYDRELTDVFKMQDDITSAIIKELRVHLESAQASQAKAVETDLTTYETYLRARQQLAMRREHLYEAKKLFEQAIKLDPKYAPAYSGLGRTLALIPLWFSEDPEEYFVQARENAEQSIKLNPNNAEGYSVMGTVAGFYDWNWEVAENYFDKSYSINPNDTEILNFLGDYYMATWNPKLIEVKQRAFDLDPLHPVKSNDLAYAYVVFGEYENAVEQAELSMKLDSLMLNPFNNYMDAKFHMGEAADMEFLIKKYTSVATISNREISADIKAANAFVAYLRKDTKTFRSLVEELKELTLSGDYYPTYLAYLYVLDKRYTDAAEWINVAYDEKDPYLVYDWRLTLPEDSPDDPALQSALDKPELQALFEIRRKNKLLRQRAR